MRATFETALDKGLLNEAQAVFLCTVRDNACLTMQKFDITWVSTGIRVSVHSASLVTEGANSVLNRDRFNTRVPGIDVDLLQTLLEVWTVALFTII